MAQIVDQFRAEEPTETEQIVTTNPPSLSENLTTANIVQATSDPAITSLMVTMMSNMEAMRVYSEESDAEQRNGDEHFVSRPRHRE